jgi:hypothetical protein
MRPLTLLIALCLLVPAAAWADDDDETPPWDVPEGDDDDDDEAPPPAAEEPAPAPAPAPVAVPDGYRSGGPVGLGFSAGTLNGFSLKICRRRATGSCSTWACRTC